MKKKDIEKFYDFLDNDEVELRAIEYYEEDGEIKSRIADLEHVKSKDDFVKFCEKHDGNANIYAGVHQRRPGGSTMDDVVSVKCIPIDIDSEREKNQAATKEELRKAENVMGKIYNDYVTSDKGTPLVAMSGNGYHLYFKIPEIEVTDENRVEISKKLQAYIKNLKHEYEEEGVNIDNVGDLPRIMKVPGTMSVKGKDTEERPHRCSKLVHSEYESSEKVRDELLLTPIDSNNNNKELKVDENFKSEDFEKLLDKDEKLKNLFEGNWEQYSDDWENGTRSEAEYALVHKLLWYEIPEDEIKKIMSNCGIGKWQDSNKRYREHTLEKAKQECGETKSDMMEKMEQNDFDVEPEDLSNDQKEIIRVLYKNKLSREEMKNRFGGDWQGKISLLRNKGLLTLYGGGEEVSLTKKGTLFYEENKIALGKEMERVLTEEEVEEAMEFLKRKDLLKEIVDDMDKAGIIGERDTKTLIFMIFLSCITDEPQHLIVTGDSSAGKSYTLNRVADYFEGRVKRFSRLSPKAIEYYEESLEGDTLDGKIMIVQESQGMDETDNIRPILSQDGDGSINIGNVHDKEYKELHIQGTPVLATSHVNLDIEHQFSTRVWNVSPDMSEQQTKNIVVYQKRLAKYPWLKYEPQQKIMNAISLLENKDVLIPYISLVKVPTDKVRARRDNEKLQSLIKLSAILHQYQRPEITLTANGTEHDFIVATYEDLKVAEFAGSQALMRSYQELDQRLEQFYQKVLDLDEEQFTNKSLGNNLHDYTQDTSAKYMRELVKKGLAVVDKGTTPHVYTLRDDMQPQNWAFYEIKKLDKSSKREKIAEHARTAYEKLISDESQLDSMVDKVIQDDIVLPDREFTLDDIPGAEEFEIDEIKNVFYEKETEKKPTKTDYNTEDLIEFAEEKIETETLLEQWQNAFGIDEDDAEELLDYLMQSGKIVEVRAGIVKEV